MKKIFIIILISFVDLYSCDGQTILPIPSSAPDTTANNNTINSTQVTNTPLATPTPVSNQGAIPNSNSVIPTAPVPTPVQMPDTSSSTREQTILYNLHEPSSNLLVGNTGKFISSYKLTFSNLIFTRPKANKNHNNFDC